MSSNATMNRPATPRPRRDKSNVILAAVLVACVLMAYGWGTNDPLWRWILPGGVVALAVLYAFLPRPGSRGAGDGGHRADA
jgi:hypothetical protein